SPLANILLKTDLSRSVFCIWWGKLHFWTRHLPRKCAGSHIPRGAPPAREAVASGDIFALGEYPAKNRPFEVGFLHMVGEAPLSDEALAAQVRWFAFSPQCVKLACKQQGERILAFGEYPANLRGWLSLLAEVAIFYKLTIRLGYAILNTTKNGSIYEKTLFEGLPRAYEYMQ
ncbi:MAG: hypothetical protein IKA64_02705, partial [Clostridia bacterium]|nr:hypothetical protein [Clostridia bacterium]